MLAHKTGLMWLVNILTFSSFFFKKLNWYVEKRARAESCVTPNTVSYFDSGPLFQRATNPTPRYPDSPLFHCHINFRILSYLALKRLKRYISVTRLQPRGCIAESFHLCHQVVRLCVLKQVYYMFTPGSSMALDSLQTLPLWSVSFLWCVHGFKATSRQNRFFSEPLTLLRGRQHKFSIFV